MQKMKILIVEDELLICELIKKWLREIGITEVVNAISYNEAVAKYHSFNPDIILLDIRLYGELTGVDFANYLKLESTTTAVIFLTSQDDKMTKDLAFEVNPDAFLSKPIRRDMLVNTIQLTQHRIKNINFEPKFRVISDAKDVLKFNEADLVYVKSEHVYTNLHFRDKSVKTLRSSFDNIFNYLNPNLFVQCHRSYLVNLLWVKKVTSKELQVGDILVPVSRTQKKNFDNYFESYKLHGR